MWRRLPYSQLKTLAPWRSASTTTRFASAPIFSTSPPLISPSASDSLFLRNFSSVSGTPFRPYFPLRSSCVSESAVKKKLEDIMPIATGHEQEELEAELQGRDILDINYPAGPFGTTEAPGIVKSVYDRRIVGCPGGEGEDEHDVVWFWLEKGKPHECPVCSQHFVLEVVGPGGPPPEEGHGHGDHH